MSTVESETPKIKRRQHTPEFRARVLQECEEPGRSTAEVARRYQLNANLIHKWRRDGKGRQNPAANEFVSLPMLAAPQPPPTDAVIKIELSTTTGTVMLHWPFTRASELVHWLRQL